MNNEINEKLEKARQGIVRLSKIDAMLYQLRQEQSDLQRKIPEMEKILQKENCDVEKIENRSIGSIFYGMLGKLEEHVEKERQEALAAKLKYDQAVRDLEDVQYQLSQYSNERVNYQNSRREYDALYEQKKDLLMKEAGASAQQIMDLTDQMNSEKTNQKEIREAISAGQDVLNSLKSVLSSLDGAEGWGTWDLLGGGLVSDLAKHSRIDDAKEETENTQRLLRRFRSELADVRIDADLRIETGGFAKFADFFFDGLIADWYMQSRIHESQDNVSRVKDQVESVLSKLRSMDQRADSEIKNLRQQIEQLIVTA